MEGFWAVIAGAFISFVGVLVSLRWNQKLHEKNLQEERRKINEEREFIAKQQSLMYATAVAPKQIVSFEELLMSQVTEQEALTRLLIEKGILQRKSFLRWSNH